MPAFAPFAFIPTNVHATVPPASIVEMQVIEEAAGTIVEADNVVVWGVVPVPNEIEMSALSNDKVFN